jgi:hypothetical protein
MFYSYPNMSTRKLAVMVVFAAIAFIGATAALSTVGLLDSIGPSLVYAPNHTMAGGGNLTGNMTGALSNMTQ